MPAGKTGPNNGSGPSWIVIADRHRCRLFEAGLDSRQRPELREAVALEFEGTPGEHGRPSPRVGKDGHSYASRNHEEDDLTHQFAREVMGLVRRQLEASQGKLALVAPDRFLGALRKHVPPHLGQRIVEHVGEFTKLTPSQLRELSWLQELLA